MNYKDGLAGEVMHAAVGCMQHCRECGMQRHECRVLLISAWLITD